MAAESSFAGHTSKALQMRLYATISYNLVTMSLLKVAFKYLLSGQDSAGIWCVVVLSFLIGAGIERLKPV